MSKKYHIAALGELLIDFTDAGYGSGGMKLFEQNPGGAPANLLTAAAHMGCRTAFIGKVGKDMHGVFLKETLRNEGIDVSGIIEDENYFTTLAFVEIDADGERHFSFARKPGADTMLGVNELDRDIITNCEIFHFGSLSLTDEPSKSATIEAVKTAAKSGAVISYDPNYRASLWKNREIAIKEMKAAVSYADVMKVSDEESLLLTGAGDYESAADKLLLMGPEIVAVTLGCEGVLIASKGKKEIIPGFKVEAVDTTGAGDSFWGGFLSRLLEGGKSWENIKKCAIRGNALASLCIQKRGGIPAIPSKEQVDEITCVFFKN